MKSNEVLVTVRSKTGRPRRLTGNVNRTMHFGPSVSQKPQAGFCCSFSTETKQLVKDRCL